MELEQGLAITSGLQESGPDAPLSVGLFGDQPLGEVIDTIKHSRLDCVQLCGEESIEFCLRVQPHAQVIKVLHVASDAGPSAVEELIDTIDAYAGAQCLVTLDSHVPGLHGGTGQAFDWGVAGQLSAKGRRFLLAGGLTPENVADAIATAHPWGVDISSGVETDGLQDPVKIKNFVANAKRQPID